MTKFVVSIIEDSLPFQQALVQILEHSDAFLPGGIYNSSEAAEELLQQPPDIVIVDIQLPGRSGIDFIRKKKPQTPNTRYLVCSMHDNDEKIFSALESGACGYLIKDGTKGQILDALLEVKNGGAPMSPAVAKRVIAFFQRPKLAAVPALLTEREQDIVQQLAKGLQYKEIAGALGISTETVKRHLRHIYQKLHVQNKIEALNKLRFL